MVVVIYRSEASEETASSSRSVSTAPTATDPSPPSDAAASLRAWIANCVSVCLVVTTVTVVLRTYVRRCLKKQWILEDCKYYSIEPLDSSSKNRSLVLLLVGKCNSPGLCAAASQPDDLITN